MNKKQFEPGKDRPRAFVTRTKKGKNVFRIYLNMDEILSNLEAGKTKMAYDIPVNDKGFIPFKFGNKGGRSWKSFDYYAWAIVPKEEAVTTP